MPPPASAMQADAMEPTASKLEREKRFQQSATQDQYAALQIRRTQEREFCVRAGLIPGANDKLVLREAMNLVGTCQDMCPLYERVERQHQNNVDKYEMIPGTRQIDPQRAVKAFHRSSAGNEQPLPSDVRPPDVLLRTLDYLIDEIVTSDQALADSHGFVRDRTRSIRTDFTLQNNRSLEAVEAHEQIARYHILCCHHLCHYEWFTIQQEKEQLGKVLQSLQEFYDDLAQAGIDCPNEPEFRAYHIIMNLFDNNMVRLAQDLDRRVFLSSAVQLALTFHSYAQFDRNPPMRPFPGNRQGSPFLFRALFKLLASHRTPYLLGCMLELQLPIIRRNALSALNYSQQVTATARFPTSLLVNYLGFDTVDDAVEYCTLYDVQANPDFVELGRKDRFNKRIFRDPDMFPSVTKSHRLVEVKRQGLSLAQLIHGAQSAFGRPLGAPAALMTQGSQPQLPTHPPISKPIGHFTLSHAMVTDIPSRLVPATPSTQGSCTLMTGAHLPMPTFGAFQPSAKPLTSVSHGSNVNLVTSSALHAKPATPEQLPLVSGTTVSYTAAVLSSAQVSQPLSQPFRHAVAPSCTAPTGPFATSTPLVSSATSALTPDKPLTSPMSVPASQMAPRAPNPIGPTHAFAVKPLPSPPPSKPAPLLTEKEADALASDIYQRLAQHELETLVNAVYTEEQAFHRQAQATWCHALASGFIQGQFEICAYLTCIHHLAQARFQYRLRQRAFVIWRTRRAQREASRMAHQEYFEYTQHQLASVQSAPDLARTLAAVDSRARHHQRLLGGNLSRQPSYAGGLASGAQYAQLLQTTLQRGTAQRTLWESAQLGVWLKHMWVQALQSNAFTASNTSSDASLWDTSTLATPCQLWLAPSSAPYDAPALWLTRQFQASQNSDAVNQTSDQLPITHDPELTQSSSYFANCSTALPESNTIFCAQAVASEHPVRLTQVSVATLAPALPVTIDNETTLTGLLFPNAACDPLPSATMASSMPMARMDRYWATERTRLQTALKHFTHCRHVPLVVVYWPTEHDTPDPLKLRAQIADRLGLPQLRSTHQIYDYLVVVMALGPTESPQRTLLTRLKASLRWLAEMWIDLAPSTIRLIPVPDMVRAAQNQLIDALTAWNPLSAQEYLVGEIDIRQCFLPISHSPPLAGQWWPQFVSLLVPWMRSGFQLLTGILITYVDELDQLVLEASPAMPAYSALGDILDWTHLRSWTADSSFSNSTAPCDANGLACIVDYFYHQIDQTICSPILAEQDVDQLRRAIWRALDDYYRQVTVTLWPAAAHATPSQPPVCDLTLLLPPLGFLVSRIASFVFQAALYRIGDQAGVLPKRQVVPVRTQLEQKSHATLAAWWRTMEPQCPLHVFYSCITPSVVPSLKPASCHGAKRAREADQRVVRSHSPPHHLTISEPKRPRTSLGKTQGNSNGSQGPHPSATRSWRTHMTNLTTWTPTASNHTAIQTRRLNKAQSLANLPRHSLPSPVDDKECPPALIPSPSSLSSSDVKMSSNPASKQINHLNDLIRDVRTWFKN